MRSVNIEIFLVINQKQNKKVIVVIFFAKMLLLRPLRNLNQSPSFMIPLNRDSCDVHMHVC